jgi:hypothetical protein
MVSYKDPRNNANIGVEQINSTLLNRATDLLGFINNTIGFEGTGAKSFTVLQNGALEETTLAIHTIEKNDSQPPWIENQNVLFQGAPFRLNQIKTKLEKNIDNIKNDIADNIENLFDVIQTKKAELNPLDSALSNANSYDDVMSLVNNFENQVLDFDQIARDIVDIYFGNQFSLSGLDLKIENDIFGLIGERGKEFSNGTTDKPKYFFSTQKRNINDENIYNRYTNELKTAYETESGPNSWSKENYLKKLFDEKQIKFSESTLNSILISKGRDRKDFKNDSQIFGLVDDVNEIVTILSGQNINQDEVIEKLFKEHLQNYIPPNKLIDITDNEAFLRHGLKQLEISIRDAFGDSEWENDLENITLDNTSFAVNFNAVNSNISNLIKNFKLKLSPELIETIIEEKNLNQDDLKKIKNSGDFLKILNQENLFEIAGKHYNLTDKKEIALKLFEENLKINTPIYYEDQRSVFDILIGKNNDHGDTNNINKIFSSLEEQIYNLGETTKNLISYGYDKPAKNNLQKYLRNNPLNSALYLENYLKNNTDSLDSNQKDTISKNIRKLLDRLDLLLKDQIKESNKEYASEIKEFGQAIKNYSAQEDKNITSILEKFNSLNPNLQKKFSFDPWPESLSAYTDENLTKIQAEMTESSKFFNTHRALYGLEMQEANKLNSQHFNKKLPEPRSDGTMPEIEEPIPPMIGPSLLSSVIVSIGNQALDRASSILETEHPDENWLTEKSSFLKKLDNDLKELPNDSTRSQKFITAIKNTFVPIIKKFLENKSQSRTETNIAKNSLINHNTTIKKLNILSGTESGFEFRIENLEQTLNQIETDLPELMNPQSINNNNKISNMGLTNTKNYLELSSRNLQALILNPPENIEVNWLQEKISKVYDLLYGDNGNSSNPTTGSIMERFSSFNNDINQACINKPDDIDQINYLNTKQVELIDGFKESIKNYTNDLTNIEDNNNFDIKQAFKDALDKAGFDYDGDGVVDPAIDSDGNGINDFQDLKNLANMISGGTNSLAGTLENVFGSKTESTRNVNQMGLRRLVLMMFLFTIFESSEWDHQRQEADISRYQIW